MVTAATGDNCRSLRSEKPDRQRHDPRCVWLTGLPGAGKTTLARRLDERLREEGRRTYVLDGDELRIGLNRDLGFGVADRIENVRRVADVAKLMADAGLVVMVSLVSPFRAGRQAARKLFADGEFVEVFVDAPLDECQRRDPKGMYGKARRGQLTQLTGIDSPYEPPTEPDLRIDTCRMQIDECVDQLYQSLFRSSGT